MSIGDEVILLRNGGIAQHGVPTDLYLHPNDRYVADFFGKADYIPIAATARDADRIRLTTQTGLVLHAPLPPALPPGDRPLCVVRPEAWTVHYGEAPAGSDRLPGRVKESMFLGNRTEALVQTPLGDLTVLAKGTMPLAEGAAVSLDPRLEFVHLIAAAPENAA